ncbi:MAG: hypothetical protein ACJ8AI_08210, partial [Rhodopila sp.]
LKSCRLTGEQAGSHTKHHIYTANHPLLSRYCLEQAHQFSTTIYQLKIRTAEIHHFQRIGSAMVGKLGEAGQAFDRRGISHLAAP